MKTAIDVVQKDHFPEHFNKNASSSSKKLIIRQNKPLEHSFEDFVKTNQPIGAVQIHEPFEVETLEGLMQGKPGDYLMRGVKGEYYVCDQVIFKETYNKV